MKHSQDSPNTSWQQQNGTLILGWEHVLGFRKWHPNVQWPGRMRNFYLKIYIHIFYVYECFSSINVCVPYVCLVPKKGRRGCLSLWYWSYGKPWEATWVQRTQQSPLQEKQVSEPLVNTQGWALSMRRNWKVSEVHTSLISCCFLQN